MRYRNSAGAQRFLVRTSRAYMGDYYLRQIALTVYSQVPLARAVLRGELEIPRHFRVLTFDGRGNGLSDRPPDADDYTDEVFGPSAPLAPSHERRVKAIENFDRSRQKYEGWQKYNRHYWLQDYRGFLEFFFGHALNEPHSTKQSEDAVGWGWKPRQRHSSPRVSRRGLMKRSPGIWRAASTAPFWSCTATRTP